MSSDGAQGTSIVRAGGDGRDGGEPVVHWAVMAWRSVLVAVALGAVLAGCGGSGGEQVRAVDLGDAAAASQATTARMVSTQEFDGEPAGQYEGVVDFEHRSARMEVSGSPLVTGLEARDLSTLPDDVPAEVREQLQKVVDLVSSADEIIVIDDASYLHVDGTWWDFGPTDPDATEQAGTLDPFAPTSALDDLAELGQVQETGTAEIRGTPATRYEASDEDTGNRFRVWVDDQGRAIRIETTMTDPDSGKDLVTTTDLFDFGVDVDIEVPKGAEPFAPVPGPASPIEVQEVASGTESGVRWTLSVGNPGNGTRCVQVDTDPALGGEVVLLLPGGDSSTQVEVPPGKPVAPSCGPDHVNGDGGSGATLLTTGGRSGDVHYLAGTIEDGADVTLTFHDGRKMPLEDRGGAWVVFFTGDDWPVRMEGGNTVCELQGDDTTSGSDLVC